MMSNIRRTCTPRLQRWTNVVWLNVCDVGNLAASWHHSSASLHFLVVWYLIFFFARCSSRRRIASFQASSPISARLRSCLSRSLIFLISLVVVGDLAVSSALSPAAR